MSFSALFKRLYNIESAVFLASFLLRAVLGLWFFHLYGHDILSFANSDALGYINNAQHLVAGEGFREEGMLSALRTPLYPLFLAGLLALKLPLILLPLFQALLFSATAVIVYKIGALLFSKRAGAIAGVLFAIEPFMAVMSNLATPETLFLFFLLLFLYLFSQYCFREKRDALLLFLSGVVLALAVLTKPVGLYLPLLLAIFLLIFGVRRGGWKKAFAMAALFLFAFSVTVFPWSLRQKLFFDSWQLSNSGTYMLYTRVLPIAVAEERGVSYEEAARILLKEELPQKIPNFDPMAMEYSFAYDAYLKKDAGERIARYRGAIFKFYLFSTVSGFFGTGYDYLLEEFGFARNYVRESFTQKLLAGDIAGFVATFFRMDVFQFAVIAGGLVWLLAYLCIGGSIWKGLRDERYRTGFILLLVLVCYFVFFSLGPQARARYRVPSYPFLFLLVGFSLDLIMGALYDWSRTVKIHKKYSWIFDFIDYSKSRVATGLIGTLVLFAFADTMGFNAWMVNLAWIPFSFVLSFGLIKLFERRMATSTTGKLKKLLLKEDDASKDIAGNSGLQ